MTSPQKNIVAALCLGLLTPSLYAQTGGNGERGGRAFIGTKIFGETDWKISVSKYVGDLDGDGCDDFLVGTTNSLPDGHVDVYSGQTMTVLRSHVGTNASDDFGRAYGGLSDWNGDGVNDYFISAPATDGFLSKVDDNVGVLTIYDGATGSILRMLGGDDVGDHFGANAFGETDLDGDGVSDLVVMSENGGVNGPTTEISVYSGADYASLTWAPYLVKTITPIGKYLNSVADADGDGLDDIVLHWGDRNRFMSSATGAIVWSPFYVSYTYDRTGDMDGDGVDDFLLGNEGNGASFADGGVWGYSGATRTSMYYVWGPAYTGWMLGASVSGVGDVDGDGLADFAAGAPNFAIHSVLDHGMVKLYSGKDGAELFDYHAYPQAEYFGYTLEAADVNGDGRMELLAGASGTNHFDGVNNYLNAGMIVPLGFDPLMLVDEDEISSAAGAVVAFYHDFPGANTDFALLASQTGTSPVTMQGGIPVPLVYDLTTSVMYNSPPAWFSNSQGATDANGQAVTMLTLAPNDAASLVGNDVWFSVLGFNGSEGPGMHWASCAQKLTVLP